MTKAESARRTQLAVALHTLGFTYEESRALRRISLTLRRWHEMECGTEWGCIERDPETDRPYWVSEWGAQWGRGMRTRTPIADRETGARKRLAAILKARNERHQVMNTGYYGLTPDALDAYVQTDPRGAALYILRPGDIPAGSDPDSCYTRGVCVY